MKQRRAADKDSAYRTALRDMRSAALVVTCAVPSLIAALGFLGVVYYW